jgi:hypothetical protein
MASEGSFNLMSIVVGGSFGALAGAAVNLLMHGRERHEQMRTFAKALAREVLLITRKLKPLPKDMASFVDNSEYIDSPDSPLTKDDLAVFYSNTDKIGLLDEKSALSSLKFYGNMVTVRAFRPTARRMALLR